MKQKRRKKLALIESNLVTANELSSRHGFVLSVLNQKSPMHCRYTKGPAMVDFWPATGRCLAVGSKQKAQRNFAELITESADTADKAEVLDAEYRQIVGYR